MPAAARLVAATLAFAGAGSALAHDVPVQVRDAANHGVEDAVVLAVPANRKLMEQARTDKEVVDQIDKEFTPYVKPVYADTLVRFPNRDNIRHHVYSFSPAKRFELPLYSGTAAAPVTFDKPGVVVLGCNIHDWMVGYIYVADTPFFAKTDSRGQATLDNLPAGEYTLRVWHPQMAETEAATLRHLNVGVQNAGVEWSLHLRPRLHIPRPIPGLEMGYR